MFWKGGDSIDRTVVVGDDRFESLIQQGGYYVDKTELLYELLAKSRNLVTLFTRPRRFGKTLTLSMMDSFFDITRDSSSVFKDCKILKNHPDFCREWMNQYPTLFLPLKTVEGLNFVSALKMLKAVVADLCKKHAPLLDLSCVDADDAAKFARLKNETADLEETVSSLVTLMRMMYAVYGKPVILLIDEYDVPLEMARVHGYYDEMLDVVRGMLNTSLKTNAFLQFAVMTGCLRISMEDTFPIVNNITSFSVLDEEYSQYFGFTQDEVEELLRYFNLEDKMEIMRSWYDGYVFGDTEIYCPWDVMSYVSDLRINRDARPKAYWQNTSGNDAIQAFFELGNESISDQFEILLNGGTINETVTNAMTYQDVYESESNLWSVLLMTGYLTTVSQEEEEELEEVGQSAVELRIPNREIARIFQSAVVNHFRQTVDQNRISELMRCLWNGDDGKASEILSDLLFETISYMDYHEDYYHAFVAGIFAGRGYVPKSNKERGLGRPDVDLRDKKNRRAMIIEAKKSDSMNRLEYWCDYGIQQIIDNEYAKNMKGYNEILCYGIAFFEKSCKVKLMR